MVAIKILENVDQGTRYEVTSEEKSEGAGRGQGLRDVRLLELGVERKKKLAQSQAEIRGSHKGSCSVLQPMLSTVCSAMQVV